MLCCLNRAFLTPLWRTVCVPWKASTGCQCSKSERILIHILVGKQRLDRAQGQARNLKTHPAATGFFQASPSEVFPHPDCLWTGWVMPTQLSEFVFQSCVAGGDGWEPAHRKVKRKMCEIAVRFVRVFLNPCLCGSILDKKCKPGGLWFQQQLFHSSGYIILWREGRAV